MKATNTGKLLKSLNFQDFTLASLPAVEKTDSPTQNLSNLEKALDEWKKQIIVDIEQLTSPDHEAIRASVLSMASTWFRQHSRLVSPHFYPEKSKEALECFYNFQKMREKTQKEIEDFEIESAVKPEEFAKFEADFEADMAAMQEELTNIRANMAAMQEKTDKFRAHMPRVSKNTISNMAVNPDSPNTRLETIHDDESQKSDEEFDDTFRSPPRPH